MKKDRFYGDSIGIEESYLVHVQDSTDSTGNLSLIGCLCKEGHDITLGCLENVLLFT